MRFNKISIKDKALFQKALSSSCHGLCAYSFQNIYIWKGLFDISWAVIDGNLCVFFKDAVGCFLYLPPLSQSLSLKAVEESFVHMDRINRNRAVSRIENVEIKQAGFFAENGYVVSQKYGDYICQTNALAALRGDRFKSKRAVINHFVKNNDFDYLPYAPEYEKDCVCLYKRWMENRKENNSDPVFQGMLYDNMNCLKVMLEDFERLDCEGRVIKMGGRVKAFTFGFSMNETFFCILFEIADLSVKGLSQYIFREFSSQLRDYSYINIMDDSGLANLKKAKESYHPKALIPNFIITRPDA